MRVWECVGIGTDMDTNKSMGKPTMIQNKQNALAAITQARAALAELLQSGIPLTEEEFERACRMYAEASIMVWRLG
jgi:hypothetical protein